MMKRLFSYFLQGLIYIAPIGVTIYIMVMVFNVVDGSLQNFLFKIWGIHIPGLGLVVLFFSLALLGYLGTTIIATPIKNLVQQLLERMPLIKVIYSSIRDFLQAFAGKDRKFSKPVMVKVNTISNLHKLGFITETDLSRLNLENMVAVYFPHSYNFSGELFLVPADQVTPIDINAAYVMKFVVSGGISGWEADENLNPENVTKPI